MMSSILVQAAPRQLAAASPVGGPTMWMQVWALQGQPRAGRPEPLLPSQFTWQASLWFPCYGWHSLSSCLLIFQSRADQAEGGSGGEEVGCPYMGSRAHECGGTKAEAPGSELSWSPSLAVSLERLPQLCGPHGLKQFLSLGIMDIWGHVIL